MSLIALLAKFVQFADLTVRSIRVVLQLLQFAVLLAATIFHHYSGKRHAAV